MRTSVDGLSKQRLVLRRWFWLLAFLLVPAVAAAFTSSNAPHTKATILFFRDSTRSIPLPSSSSSSIFHRGTQSQLHATTKTKISASKQTTINVDQLDQQLRRCTTGTAARRVLETTLLKNKDKNGSSAPLYNSIRIPTDASTREISDGDLAIMVRLTGTNSRYTIMELIELNGNRDADRVSLAVACVLVGSTISALLANQNRNLVAGPEILRFVVVWLFSFAPLALVGYGIAVPDQLQTKLVQLQRTIVPQYRKRMVQHEAGHLLMGHLLGVPLEGYTANAVKNAVTFYPLADVDAGTDYATQLGFDSKKRSDTDSDDADKIPYGASLAPFFSDEGRGSKTLQEQSVFRKEEQRTTKTNYTAFLTLDQQDQNPNMEPRKTWPYRGFDDATLDQLTIISVAGVCSEILGFGNAEGGLADFNQLKSLLAAKQISTSDEPMTEREVTNRIRYALGYTMSQLRRHLGALDALAVVMERDGSLAECVAAIEMCSSVSGSDGIVTSVADYEQHRKEQFRQSNGVLRAVETALIGDVKTADAQDDRFIQGKGGGDKKQKFLLTGDDPLYLALAIAAIFLLWASGGGLSLH